jgi:hypothetical protein
MARRFSGRGGQRERAYQNDVRVWAEIRKSEGAEKVVPAGYHLTRRIGCGRTPSDAPCDGRTKHKALWRTGTPRGEYLAEVAARAVRRAQRLDGAGLAPAGCSRGHREQSVLPGAISERVGGTLDTGLRVSPPCADVKDRLSAMIAQLQRGRPR